MENLSCFLLKFVNELAKIELGVKITTLIEFMVSFVDINTSFGVRTLYIIRSVNKILHWLGKRMIVGI